MFAYATYRFSTKRKKSQVPVINIDMHLSVCDLFVCRRMYLFRLRHTQFILRTLSPN